MSKKDLPPSGWMLKPRSRIQGEGGGTDRSLFGAFRGFKADTWQRRYISVRDGTSVTYGKSLGHEAKTIPFEKIRAATSVTAEQMMQLKVPSAHRDHGWMMVTEGKDLYFAAENAAVRDQWVSFLQGLVLEMTGDSGSMGNSVSCKRTVSITTISMISETNKEFVRDEDTDSVSTASKHGDVISKKSQQELRMLAGIDPDEDDSRMNIDRLIDIAENHDMDDEDEEDDDQDEDYEETDTGVLSVKKKHADEPGIKDSKENMYRNFLQPIANKTYNHIESRIDSYSTLFKMDDSPKNILFSCSIQKINRNGNLHDRDLIITSKYIYFFGKGRFGKTDSRIIDMDQVVGVVESTIESTLFALIIPSFHDILIKIIPQKSAIGGNETDVKHQILAHVFCAHRKLVDGRPFIFRGTDNISAVIRRTENDQHLPLLSKPNDKLRVATNAQMYPTLRTNADSVVHFSCMCFRITSDRESHLRAFILTDNALYTSSEKINTIAKRTSIRDVKRVLYDVNSHGLLFKCGDVDMLVNIREDSDFNSLLVDFPDVAFEACGRKVKMTASSHLFSSAHLISSSTWKKYISDPNMMNNMLKLSSYVSNTKESGFFGKAVGGKPSLDTTTDLMAVVGAAGNILMKNQRYVFETCLTVRDEERLLCSHPPFPDKLKLQNSPLIAQHRLGIVTFSSRCRVHNISSFMKKTDELIAVVCNLGFYVFHAPDSRKVWRGIFTTGNSNSLVISDSVEFGMVKALVTCDGDTTLVGVMTTNKRNTDILVRLPNATFACEFVTAFAALCTSTNSISNFVRTVLPVYRVERTENLKLVLKKTINDPPPTIACRQHPYSDQLLLSVLPEVADLCRRFGDNTILFSGKVCCFRDSVLKNNRTFQREETSIATCSEKLLKCFILIITNCAIYLCTLEGYEMVRRTDLKSITQVCFDDTDTILLVVPQEYDLLMRIDDGRRKEFKDRLQDAFLLWTDFGWYRPGETPNSHDPENYFYPNCNDSNLVARANLVIPHNFKQLQAIRNAVDVAKETELWFRCDLKRGIDRYKQAISAAEIEQYDMNSSISPVGITPTRSYNNSSTYGSTTPTWSEVWGAITTAISYLKFSYCRAYLFGFRSCNVPELVTSAKLMMQWREMTLVVAKLTDALMEEKDTKLYEATVIKAKGYASLNLLIKEQEPLYKRLLVKGQAIDNIQQALEEESSVVDRKEKICVLLEKAIATGERKEVINNLLQSIDKRVQKERISNYIMKNGIEESKHWTQSERQVLLDCCHELGLNNQSMKEIIVGNRRGSCSEVDTLVEYLHYNIMTGDVSNLSSACSYAKCVLGLQTNQQDVQLAVAELKQQYCCRQEADKMSTSNFDTLPNLDVTDDEKASFIDEIPYLNKTDIKIILREVYIALAEMDLLNEAKKLIDDLDEKKALFLRGGSCRFAAMSVDELRHEESSFNLIMTSLRNKLKEFTSNTSPKVSPFAASVGRSLYPHISVVKLYIDRISSAIDTECEIEQNQMMEADAMREHNLRVKKKQSMEKRKKELDFAEQEYDLHVKREELGVNWKSRAYKLNTTIKQSVLNSSVECVKSQLRSIDALYKDVLNAMECTFPEFYRNFSLIPRVFDEDHRTRIKSLMKSLGKTVKLLEEATSLGQVFLKKYDNVSYEAEMGIVEIPPDILQAIKALDKETVIRFVKFGVSSDSLITDASSKTTPNLEEQVKCITDESNVNSNTISTSVKITRNKLNLATIAEVRKLWKGAASEKGWIAQLHQSIHTAVALKNISLIEAQLDIAKERDYKDHVVKEASDILEIMRQKQHEQDKCSLTVSNDDQDNENSAFSKMKRARRYTISRHSPSGKSHEGENDKSDNKRENLMKPKIVRLSRAYKESSKSSQESVMGTLEEQTAMLLKDITAQPTAEAISPEICETDEGKRKCDAFEVKLLCVSEDSSEVRKLVGAIVSVIEHNVKPTGLFKKVHRTVFDVLKFLGEVQIEGGCIAAPYTNRLVNDFDRIKRYNNTKGHTESYLLVAYILFRDSLIIVLNEIFTNIPEKVINELFMDEAVFREKGGIRNDLLSIAKMLGQVKWSFMFTEKSNIPKTNPASTSVTSPINGNKAAGGKHTTPIEEAATQTVVQLRRAVSALSEYFSTSLESIGRRPAAADVLELVDERKSKGIGLVIRDIFCPVIKTLLLHGFKSSYLMHKRHLWDFILVIGTRLRESARDLIGVAVPEAIDLIMSLTDLEGRCSASIHRLSEEQLKDVRFRMFICHLLNTKALGSFFTNIFLDGCGDIVERGSSAAGNEDVGNFSESSIEKEYLQFLEKYYYLDKCVMLAHGRTRREIIKLLTSLSSINFLLCIDAEIW